MARSLARRFPYPLAILVIFWLFPRNDFGLSADDYLIRAAIEGKNLFGHLGENTDASFWARVSNTFHFFTAEQGTTDRLKAYGALPWWTDDGALVRMFRPLAGLTYWIDFAILGGNLLLVQIHSLLWFIAMAISAWWFYRRHLGAGLTAALAALMYTINLNHLSHFGWLAARNAYMAPFFGIWAIIFHEAWRKDGRLLDAVYGWAALSLALLSAEAGVAAVAYLTSYALILDRRGPLSGLAAIVPAMLLTVLCRLVAAEFGFGAANVGLYLDPLRSPLAFLQSVGVNGPVLVLSTATGISNSLPAMGGSATILLRAITVGVVVLVGLLFRPVLRRDKQAAFFGLGSLLAVVPYCAMAASTSRSTVFIGIGFSGALAVCVRHWLKERDAGAALLKALLVAGILSWHVMVPALAGMSHSLSAFEPGREISRGELKYSLPDESGRGIVYLNYPSAVQAMFLPFTWSAEGIPLPKVMFQIVPGLNSYTLKRTGERELLARSDGEFVLNHLVPVVRRGRPLGNGDLYAMRATQAFVSNPARRYRAGEILTAGPMTITVIEVDDGIPTELRLHFDASVDLGALAWRLWNWKTWRMEAVPAPAVGESLLIVNQ